MNNASFRFEPLGSEHERMEFASESDLLNRYFHQQVTQDVRRRVTACYVVVNLESRIVGYYTLAAASVPVLDLPDAVSKKLPRYPSLPAVRIGRLAVDKNFSGQGFGGALLADALGRAARLEIAAFACVVDAKDKRACAFYQHHGFNQFFNSPLTLFIPLATVRTLA
jgi:GNAT superfamily N-acetyltransferase